MKLFVLDGHALIFKMYYAFLGRPMVNSKGVDTSILFGFTKYLLELIEREKPTHLAVSFDPPGGTFRNRLFTEYKANRDATPQLVIDALEPLTKIVKSLGIPVLMIPDFEADDVIGTISKRCEKEGFEVYMVTPDKDYGQLVSEKVFQYKPGKSGSDNEVLGPDQICEKWDISSPLQVIDMLAICGDSADNVPGVQGVGPKGAAKLLREFGSIENIYENLDSLSQRQKEQFEAAKDHIGLSKTLVTIRTDVPVEIPSSDFALKAHIGADASALMDLYEMPSLKGRLKSLFGIDSARETPVAQSRPEPVSAPVIENLAAIVIHDGVLHLDFNGKYESGQVERFKDILEDDKVTKAGHGLKESIKVLISKGIEMRGPMLDLELMHYVLNPERSHKLEFLAGSLLGLDLDSQDSAESGDLFADVSADDAPNMELRVKAIAQLAPVLQKDLSETGMDKLYSRIEAPLVFVLARMEMAGVKVDMNALRKYASGLRQKLLETESLVRELSGVPDFNVASPKQVGEIIFEKLQLVPKAKKPKNGNWPTDEQTLSEIEHPIVDAILEYRGLRKLLSTYIEPFPAYVSPVDGRVHTCFNQALTSTGRLSSSNPNLQNIPIRTAEGREIRKAFVPENENSVIMSADYSQIELRVMAHFCGDEHLVGAFRSGADIHAATAAKIYGIPVGEVTAEQRRMAKTVNFGIMYGMSAFGLSQRLKCSRTDAKKLIEDYFASFPSIRSFIDRTVAGAKNLGYVETIFGRRRYIPDINSSNAMSRALAERNAVNAPIQGSAADMIKLAMIAVDKRLREEDLQSRIVLQIHDELLLEVPSSEKDRVKAILEEEMQGVVKLSVPLTVECNYGSTWLEAH